MKIIHMKCSTPVKCWWCGSVILQNSRRVVVIDSNGTKSVATAMCIDCFNNSKKEMEKANVQ